MFSLRHAEQNYRGTSRVNADESGSKFNRTPYEELSGSWLASGHAYQLTTPWLRVVASVPEEQVADVESLLHQLDVGINRPCDISDFLARFADYPFSYILPRDKIWKPVAPQYTPTFGTPKDLAKELQKQSSLRIWAEVGTCEPQGPFAWNWSLASISMLALVEKNLGFDPLSAFTVLRRFALKERYEQLPWPGFSNWMQQLAMSNPIRYRKAVVNLLRIQHYVISTCCNTVLLVETSNSVAKQIQSYIASERSREQSCALALASLGISAGEVLDMPVSPYWFYATEVLRLAARTDPFAFACVVDFFEILPSSWQSSHFFDAMTSLPDGAKAVQIVARTLTHERNPTRVGERFVADLPPISAQQIRLAANLLEFASNSIRRFFADDELNFATQGFIVSP